MKKKVPNFFLNFLHNPLPVLGLLDTLMRSIRHHLATLSPILHFRDFSANLKFLGDIMILCHMFVPTGHGLHLRAMWKCCVKLCTTSSSF